MAATFMHPSSQPSIDSFVDALWLEDGLSTNTLQAYRRDLTLYARWLGTQGLALNDTTETLLNGYFADQHASTRATSANRRLSVFKRYFHWALRERMATGGLTRHSHFRFPLQPPPPPQHRAAAAPLRR